MSFKTQKKEEKDDWPKKKNFRSKPVSTDHSWTQVIHNSPSLFFPCGLSHSLKNALLSSYNNSTHQRLHGICCQHIVHSSCVFHISHTTSLLSTQKVNSFRWEQTDVSGRSSAWRHFWTSLDTAIFSMMRKRIILKSS